MDYLKDKELNTALESYFSEDTSVVTEAEFRDNLISKNRFESSKDINTKSNLLGAIIRANKVNKNDAEVDSILAERQLTNTYETETGKLVFTSPILKLDGKEVRFVSSASKACRDGFSSIHNVGSLKNFLALYDMLAKDSEKLFQSFLADGCKWMYEDRNETIDKNYSWIAKNWLKIKNIYIYTVYSNGSTDMYCDVEVDISKFKGLQDYLSKKSCALMYYRVNLNSGKMYVGQDILNDRTELFKLIPINN